MKIAITVWGNRISPVLDSAQTLLVVGVEGSELRDRQIVSFPSGILSRLLDLLEEKEVKVLICGALCQMSVRTMEARGVEVFPFVTGEVERVLEIYLQGADISQCLMPGCGSARCCRTNSTTGLIKKHRQRR